MSRMPKLKPDEKGQPRYMPASYIMRKDTNAQMAYQALRRRGVSRAEAEHAIELTNYEAFVEVLTHEGPNWRDADRRPEVWFLLAEGLPIERIFPDRPPRHRPS
jgi:hypothetical protein